MKCSIMHANLLFLISLTTTTISIEYHSQQPKVSQTCSNQCKNKTFTYFNQSKMLVPGTMQRPGAAERFQNISFLEPHEIQFLNLVHWIQHTFEVEKTYDYIKNNKAIIQYKGKSITITDWNLDHVFVGDLYPDSEFIAGMHNNHPGLKRFYHYKKQGTESFISHPKHAKHQKVTKLLPKKWNTLITVKKIMQALRQKKLHIIEQNGKLRTETTIGNIPFVIVIKPNGNLKQAATGSIITFYPTE